MQAAGVQVEPLGQQFLVEGAEHSVVFGDGPRRSQPLHVDHLSPAQEEADPLFEAVGLVLQAAEARQLHEELRTAEQRSETVRNTESPAGQEL